MVKAIGNYKVPSAVVPLVALVGAFFVTGLLAGELPAESRDSGDGESKLVSEVVSNRARYVSKRLWIYGYLGVARDFSNNSWFMIMPYPELGNPSLFDAVVPLTIRLRIDGELEMSTLAGCIGDLVSAAGTVAIEGTATILIVDTASDPITSFSEDKMKRCN